MGLQIQALLETVHIEDCIDILLVAVLLYYLYKWIKDTRAFALLKGLVVLGIVTVVSHELNLHVINWLLQQSMTIIFVALPVVFQPELRRALEQIGRGGFISKGKGINNDELTNVISEVVAAVKVMSRERIGALLVFEREVGLGEIADTGIPMDAIVTRQLINNIFVPNTPLHDGAVVIRGGRIVAAGCLLPLTGDRSLSTELGTRHRAAIGISEQGDAIVVVVSEETGKISYTYGGHIYRGLTDERLRDSLRSFLNKEKRGFSIRNFFRRGA